MYGWMTVTKGRAQLYQLQVSTFLQAQVKKQVEHSKAALTCLPAAALVLPASILPPTANSQPVAAVVISAGRMGVGANVHLWHLHPS